MSQRYRQWPSADRQGYRLRRPSIDRTIEYARAMDRWLWRLMIILSVIGIMLNENLVSMDLSNSPFDEPTCLQCAYGLRVCRNLRSFNIENCKIGPKGNSLSLSLPLSLFPTSALRTVIARSYTKPLLSSAVSDTLRLSLIISYGLWLVLGASLLLAHFDTAAGNGNLRYVNLNKNYMSSAAGTTIGQSYPSQSIDTQALFPWCLMILFLIWS